MRCFFYSGTMVENDLIRLDKREEAHLFKTLRAKSGDRIELINGKGVLGMAIVQEGKELLVQKVECVAEPDIKVHVFFAPPKKHKLDVVLKQCAELGAWSINPFISERSVSLPKGNVKERWSHYLTDACKQAKNPFIPEIHEVYSWQDMLNTMLANNYLAFYGGFSEKACITLPAIADTVNDIAWIVGPEGGFTNTEIAQFHENQLHEMKLGNWVLRTETAITAGLAVINQCYCF